ncbi:unnamed protein product, partial [marine sediment metagenome]
MNDRRVDRETLARKTADSEKIIRQAFEKFAVEDLAIAWTGGKDSTVMLWLIRR